MISGAPYQTATNRLLGVIDQAETPSRSYSYEENEEKALLLKTEFRTGSSEKRRTLLTDNYRNVDATEYGRAAYAYHITQDDKEISYLYSVDDQRMFKKISSPTETKREYYLSDAMEEKASLLKTESRTGCSKARRKVVALRSEITPSGQATTSLWEYYINGSEREARLVNQNTDPKFGTGEVNFFLYDHLGNTRLNYTPVIEISEEGSQDVFNDVFEPQNLNGWEALDPNTSVTNNAGALSVTNTSANAVAIKPAISFQQGLTYTLSVSATEVNVTSIDVVIDGLTIGTIANSGMLDVFTFVAPTTGVFDLQIIGNGTSGTREFNLKNVHLEVETPQQVEYTYTVNFVADYFPYGKIVREYVNSGGQERYLTTQHERDQETGFDYRGARYYDSDVARFLSLDPLANKFPSWSAYNYVMGNPLILIDPSGKSPEGTGDKDKPVKKGSSAANSAVSGVDNGLVKSNDAPPKSKLNTLNLVKTVNDNIGTAATVAVEGATAYIASQFKSNTNNFTFSQLTDKQQNWRVKAEFGGAIGLKALNAAKFLGTASGVVTPVIHGYQMYNNANDGDPSTNNSTMDKVDLGVEIAVGATGAASSLNLFGAALSNPIGWVAGVAGIGYASFRYGQTHDVLEDFRAEPGLNSCFIIGTKILMLDGTQREVENIQIGDSVLSYNFQSNKIESKKVIEVASPIHTKMVEINFTNGNKNLNTFDHPYFVKGKGWASYDPAMTFEKYKLKVEKIKNGDFCYLYENGILVETEIESLKEVTGNYQTYNLNNVEDNNNFFANGVLVHNKVIPISDNTIKEIPLYEMFKFLNLK